MFYIVGAVLVVMAIVWVSTGLWFYHRVKRRNSDLPPPKGAAVLMALAGPILILRVPARY